VPFIIGKLFSHSNSLFEKLVTISCLKLNNYLRKFFAINIIIDWPKLEEIWRGCLQISGIEVCSIDLHQRCVVLMDLLSGAISPDAAI
jgi:hypothetical protein